MTGRRRASASLPVCMALAAAVSGAVLSAAGEPPHGSLPWSAWFKKNTTVADKKSYVHFFWNANDVRGRFEVRDREVIIAEAGRQLVARQYPKSASADWMKIDIVFITERDSYGMPKWDTLRRVAHLEGSRRKILAAGGAASDARRAFDRFELY